MIQLVMVLHPMSTGVNQVRAGSLQPAVAIILYAACPYWLIW